MGKITETLIDKFGSMSAELRKNNYDFALSSHFKVFRRGHLSPNVSYTSITDASENIHKFLYAKHLDGATITYDVYGLGQDGSGRPTPYRTLPTTGTPSWTASTATSTSSTWEKGVFFEYKDYLYGWHAGNKLWQIGPLTAASPTATDAFKTISYTTVAQPVHHKADDYAYFFYDNKVCRHTGATASTVWTSDVLTLPTNMKIIGGASYGNYLAIICSPIEPGTTNSVMYLWDRDSSLSTLTSKIDLGMGEAVHVSESEDGGVWITQRTQGIAGIDSVNNSITVKYFNGTLFSKEIPVGMETDYFTSISLSGNPCEERNVFYFPGKVVTEKASETRHLIFAARMNGGRIELIADQEITGVTNSINGIFCLAGIWYVSYDTTAKCLQSKLSSTFATGTFESRFFNDGDESKTKKLLGATVTTSPLPASATASLYYRIDNETSWTLIFSHTSTGSLSHSAINIESSGANLPQYKEVQFKILSTGGAEITGFKYKSEFIDKDLY